MYNSRQAAQKCTYLNKADASTSKYKGWKANMLQFYIFSMHIKSFIKTLFGFSHQVIS
jgi:hypothetical protein